MKPHRGLVEDWYIQSFDKEKAQSMYPGEDLGLGYIIRGRVLHLSSWSGGNTSWVMFRDGNEIETRNSKYTLGKPLGAL